jgi:hypothetical protein
MERREMVKNNERRAREENDRRRKTIELERKRIELEKERKRKEDLERSAERRKKLEHEKWKEEREVKIRKITKSEEDGTAQETVYHAVVEAIGESSTTRLIFKDDNDEIMSQRQFCYALCFNISFCRTFVETLFSGSKFPTFWECSPMFAQNMIDMDFECISNDIGMSHTTDFIQNYEYTVELGNIPERDGRADTRTMDDTVRLFQDVGRKLVKGSLIDFIPVLLTADPGGQYVVKLHWESVKRRSAE